MLNVQLESEYMHKFASQERSLPTKNVTVWESRCRCGLKNFMAFFLSLLVKFLVNMDSTSSISLITLQNHMITPLVILRITIITFSLKGKFPPCAQSFEILKFSIGCPRWVASRETHFRFRLESGNETLSYAQNKMKHKNYWKRILWKKRETGKVGFSSLYCKCPESATNYQ